MTSSGKYLGVGLHLFNVEEKVYLTYFVAYLLYLSSSVKGKDGGRQGTTGGSSGVCLPGGEEAALILNRAVWLSILICWECDIREGGSLALLDQTSLAWHNEV